MKKRQWRLVALSIESPWYQTEQKTLGPAYILHNFAFVGSNLLALSTAWGCRGHHAQMLEGCIQVPAVPGMKNVHLSHADQSPIPHSSASQDIGCNFLMWFSEKLYGIHNSASRPWAELMQTCSLCCHTPSPGLQEPGGPSPLLPQLLHTYIQRKLSLLQSTDGRCRLYLVHCT